MSTAIPARALRLSSMALLVSALYSTSAWAASDAQRIAELEKKLAQSAAQIAQNAELMARLAARIEQLEHDKPAVATVPPAAPVQPAEASAAEQRIELLERNVTQIANAAARGNSNAGVAVHGFADLGYESSNKAVEDGRKRGFKLGNVDFYLVPELGGRLKSLVELAFEYGEDGSLGTDLERLQIGYQVSDNLLVWAGRFHTPYGYWNNAFHHGAQIQTAVTRPKMVAFEDQGGILPAHLVGLWAAANARVGEGKAELDVYAGNGNRLVDGVLDYNAVKDDNRNMLVGFNARYRFGGELDGLTLGSHGLRQQVNAYAAGSQLGRSRVSMLGAYGVYDSHDWEIISEYYHFSDLDLLGHGGRRGSWAGFVQLGKTVGADLTPYARYEKANLDQGDSYFQYQDSGRSYQRKVVGVRYEVNPKAVLKFELNRSDESKDGGQKYNEARVQVGTRF